MKNLKFRSFLISFVTVCSILVISLLVIAYGRGYRLDFQKTSIKPTGLISATSDPIGAQVVIDGILKTATNNSLNVDPGWYTITISKEGFISWQKKLRVQGEVVTRADAFLFPSNPSLSPLTTIGVSQPILSPDGSRVAYIIPTDHLDETLTKKAGLWIYELSEGPLGRNRDPIQLSGIDPNFDIINSNLTWSPDSTQILVNKGIIYRLYQINRPGTFTDVSTSYAPLLSDWEDERTTKQHQQLAAFKQPIINIATTSAVILSLSPDETKILYEATAAATIPIIITPPLIGTNSTEETRTIKPGKIYVYDSREDKNYFVLDINEVKLPKSTPTPSPVNRLIRLTPTPTPYLPTQAGLLQLAPFSFIHWFPTSKHLILTLDGKIDVMEYDRTNWITIYSGPFVDSFVAPWSNGSRIIILTSLNPGTGTLPNLYTVNLR
jgi:hypothetical protein